jgi:glycoprotein endo-alpha-1,2-mannosidase
VRIAVHLEPYPGRSVFSIRQDLEYLHARHGRSRALYRINGKPVFYVYDSYHIEAQQWRRLLALGGDVTVRGTPLDAVFIGLWLADPNGRDLHRSGFDGVYSYFATDGFSYGSSRENWRAMCAFAVQRQMLCSLSISPGYDDTKIRPWNAINRRERDDGAYYTRAFEQAIDADPHFISITSWNEWGEGTQIEPAEPRRVVLPKLTVEYLDYSPGAPTKYLDLTRDFVGFWASHSMYRVNPVMRYLEQHAHEAVPLPFSDEHGEQHRPAEPAPVPKDEL